MYKIINKICGKNIKAEKVYAHNNINRIKLFNIHESTMWIYVQYTVVYLCGNNIGYAYAYFVYFNIETTHVQQSILRYDTDER